MLRLLISGLLVATGLVHAQSEVRSIPLQGATSLLITAKMSNIEVTTGTRPEVEVSHTLIVRGEPRPDLTEMKISRNENVLQIEEIRPTYDYLKEKLPRQPVRNRRGSYLELELGIEEASLRVKVPPGIPVEVRNKYGEVKVIDVAGLERVKVTYGDVDVVYRETEPSNDLELYCNYAAVDLTLPTNYGADLTLITEYGDLLSDMDISIDTSRSSRADFYEKVVGTVSGGGKQVKCETPYGTVYLRRAK